jgi:hypothetical protein
LCMHVRRMHACSTCLVAASMLPKTSASSDASRPVPHATHQGKWLMRRGWSDACGQSRGWSDACLTCHLARRLRFAGRRRKRIWPDPTCARTCSSARPVPQPVATTNSLSLPHLSSLSPISPSFPPSRPPSLSLLWQCPTSIFHVSCDNWCICVKW